MKGPPPKFKEHPEMGITDKRKPAQAHAVSDAAATNSDVPSWEEIVEQHSARVYRLAYRLTGNPHDAEDLTQEVFIRVFRSLDSYVPGSFEGWIHRITTNLFLDRVRRKNKFRFDGFTEGSEDRLVGKDPSPEFAWHDANLDPDIESALASLPEEFRVAVVLCDMEGLSYDEISAALGVKLGTVRSRIHRGRTQLREALKHRAPIAGRTRFAGPLDGLVPGA